MDSPKMKVLSCVAAAAVVVTICNNLPPMGEVDEGGCDAVGVASKWAAGVGLAMAAITGGVLVLHEVVTKARELRENLEWLSVVFPHRRAVAEMHRGDDSASMEAGVVTPQ